MNIKISVPILNIIEVQSYKAWILTSQYIIPIEEMARMAYKGAYRDVICRARPGGGEGGLNILCTRYDIQSWCNTLIELNSEPAVPAINPTSISCQEA